MVLDYNVPMKAILNNKQKAILFNIGLNKIQVELYLTSLEHGLLSVLELSRLTKINRQQIYKEAEGMVELGLYGITRKQGRKYIPAMPSKLAVLSKQKLISLEENQTALLGMLPFLEGLGEPAKNKVAVRYFEGYEKIKEAYAEELARSKDTEGLCFAGLLDHVYDYFPHAYWDKWNKQYAQVGNSSKMLVHYSELARQSVKDDAKYNRQTRYLHQFPLKVNIDIFHDYVLIVSYEDELALWVESAVVACSYRILFYALWDQAKSFGSLL